MATAQQTDGENPNPGSEMDSEDRMDLIWELSELMEQYEDRGYDTATVRQQVVGYAKGRMSDE